MLGWIIILIDLNYYFINNKGALPGFNSGNKLGTKGSLAPIGSKTS